MPERYCNPWTQIAKNDSFPGCTFIFWPNAGGGSMAPAVQPRGLDLKHGNELAFLPLDFK